MNNKQTKEWLASLHKLTADKIGCDSKNFNLDGIKELLEVLGNPQEQLSFVYVVGTNGKGSCIAYLESICWQSGIKVAAYTSPYLENQEEMIRIQGIQIPESIFAQYVKKIFKVIDQLKQAPTEYECLTAIALLYFAQEKCELVLWESALGSKNDVTNVIGVPLLTILMHMGMDHMDALGNTLEEITRSELEVLKQGTTCLTTLQKENIYPIIVQECKKLNIPWIQTHEIEGGSSSFSYKGFEDIKMKTASITQYKNAATAIEACLFLQKHFSQIKDQDIRKGLFQAYWSGRFEILRKEPMVLLDGGHNMDCLEALLSDIQNCYPNTSWNWIVGMYRDKECQDMMERISKYAKDIYCIGLNSKRSCDPKLLAKYCMGKGQEVLSFELAIQESKNLPTIIFGSLSLISMAKQYFQK